MLKSNRSKTLNRLLNTAVGEELMVELRAEFGVASYTKGDPTHTAYLEGARGVILFLDEVKNERDQ